MNTAIAQRYFDFFKVPDSANEYKMTQQRSIGTTTRISIFDVKENTDAAVTVIASAWARHTAAANGFGG